MILYAERHLLFSGRRFPGVQARDFIAELVNRRPETSLCCAPSGSKLENVAVNGVECRGVLAEFSLCPSPERTGILIFLDARRANFPPMHIYLEGHTADPQHLLRFVGIRAPPAYKIAIRPRPHRDGLLHLLEGDTVD